MPSWLFYLVLASAVVSVLSCGAAIRATLRALRGTDNVKMIPSGWVETPSRLNIRKAAL